MIKKVLQKLVTKDTKSDILEKIKKNIENPVDFYQIVSLNPEIIMTALGNEDLAHILEVAEVKLIDGTGILYAARALNIPAGDRYQGADLFQDLLKHASDHSLRVVLIGGGPKVAETVRDCQIQRGSKATITALQGISDIKNPKKEEFDHIFSIVTAARPHLIFVAFGCPVQELFLWHNRAHFKHATVMGVGGSFDFEAGIVPRAPLFMRNLGLEWLFRLMVQPWRIRRQIKLVQYCYLVVKDMFIS